MKQKNKKNVFKVYDKIIDWFDNHRCKDLSLEKSYLALIQSHLPKGSSILDIGCGTGEPIAKYFIENGYAVTGVDASKKMIALCKQRFTSGKWILADMRALNLDEQFNMVIAWHSLFHLPHADQRHTLNLLSTYVKHKGLFAFTSGPEHGEVWSDNGGHNLYHASLSTEEYRKILEQNNFKVLAHNVQDENCGEATVWVAQKI